MNLLQCLWQELACGIGDWALVPGFIVMTPLSLLNSEGKILP
jgi:hypothetical protein